MQVGGQAERRFEAVREAFGQVLADQAGTGAAVAAWWNGAWVVDLWGGWADAAGTRPWRADSLVQPYSVTKPFAAVCALLRVDRGKLELDAPVQRWWPEFKARASVRQLLSHQAGVVALDEPAPTAAFYDWDWLCSLLAAQEPAWEPGTAHGESVLFYGHLIGRRKASPSSTSGPMRNRSPRSARPSARPSTTRAWTPGPPSTRSSRS